MQAFSTHIEPSKAYIHTSTCNMLPNKNLITDLVVAGSALALPEPAPADAVENVERDAAPAAEPDNLDRPNRPDCRCHRVNNPGGCSMLHQRHG